MGYYIPKGLSLYPICAIGPNLFKRSKIATCTQRESLQMILSDLLAFTVCYMSNMFNNAVKLKYNLHCKLQCFRFYLKVAVCVGETVVNVISMPINSNGTTTQISLQSPGQIPWKAFGMAVAFV